MMKMARTITYDVKGVKRKELVEAIGEHLSCKPIYQGVPTFAYAIGEVTVDREGGVIINDAMTPAEADKLKMTLKEKGFIGTNYKGPELLEISMPREIFTGKALERLEKIIDAKRALIAKAIGTEDLNIILEDTKVTFPWFQVTEDSEEINHYALFVEALCKMAIHSKRITSKAKESTNEKYDFRCFLLRLGFIGDEHKALRKFLLRNLSGNGAFKNGRPEKE